MTIHVETLVEAFSDSVGRERARDLIMDVCDGNEEAPTFTRTEAIDVASQVANREEATPFVRTAAKTIQTRIRADHL